jgi:hypothetical protein
MYRNILFLYIYILLSIFNIISSIYQQSNFNNNMILDCLVCCEKFDKDLNKYPSYNCNCKYSLYICFKCYQKLIDDSSYLRSFKCPGCRANIEIDNQTYIDIISRFCKLNKKNIPDIIYISFILYGFYFLFYNNL